MLNKRQYIFILNNTNAIFLILSFPFLSTGLFEFIIRKIDSLAPSYSFVESHMYDEMYLIKHKNVFSLFKYIIVLLYQFTQILHFVVHG